MSSSISFFHWESLDGATGTENQEGSQPDPDLWSPLWSTALQIFAIFLAKLAGFGKNLDARKAGGKLQLMRGKELQPPVWECWERIRNGVGEGTSTLTLIQQERRDNKKKLVHKRDPGMKIQMLVGVDYAGGDCRDIIM